MHKVEANGAFGGWIGDFYEVDDGGSAVLVEYAGKKSEFCV